MAQYSRTERIKRSGFEKVRAEQLNWFLYISKGYAANLNHALRTNNFCMHTTDIKVMQKMLVNMEKNIALIEGVIHKRKGSK